MTTGGSRMKKLIMVLVMSLVLSSIGFSVNVTRVTGKTVIARESLQSLGTAELQKVQILGDLNLVGDMAGSLKLDAGYEIVPDWGTINGWDFSSGCIVSGDELKIAIDTVTTPDEYAKISLTVISGKQYRAILDVKSSSVTPNINFAIGNVDEGTSYVSETGLTVNTYTNDFTATSDTIYVTFENKSTVTANVVLNSLSIKELGEITIPEIMNYNITTSNVTVSTGNVNIPIWVNGVKLYIKANTAQ